MQLEETVAQLMSRVEQLELEIIRLEARFDPDRFEGETVEYRASDGSLYHFDQRHMKWLKLQRGAP